MRAAGRPAAFETIHPAGAARNPLPVNLHDRNALPADAGWWGYSMYDVPERESGETFIATIPDATLVSYVDEQREFLPAILTCDGKAMNLREIVFRNRHAEVLRERPRPRRIKRATWICERVYDNHSHWLTAHLPKLCLLRERDMLSDVLLPTRLSPAMEASLRLMGLDPAAFARFEPGELLQVEEFTFLSTDRFRPELLRPVREAIAPLGSAAEPHRKIYISRGKARMRRLVNEDDIWPVFERAGFERVFMEEMDFPAQVRLMSQTAMLAAPHGAGLTNMMFCPPGAQVVEIAWLGFPNPNFYALASAMGLGYALVPAEPFGDATPLQRDMVADVEAVQAALDAAERNIQPSPLSAGG